MRRFRGSSQSTTASESRKSRLRQEHDQKEASTQKHPLSLSERRRLTKERRVQRPADAAPAASHAQPSSSTQLLSSGQSRGSRSSHRLSPSSNAATSATGTPSSVASKISRFERNSSAASAAAPASAGESSPTRAASINARAMDKRQRMKQVRNAGRNAASASPRVSVGSTSAAASTVGSSATTAIAGSRQSSVPTRQERISARKSWKRPFGGRSKHSSTNNNHNDATLSPVPAANREMAESYNSPTATASNGQNAHHATTANSMHTASPQSQAGTEVHSASESNYTAETHGRDPTVSDDDATLTSVRGIMTRSSNHSNNSNRSKKSSGSQQRPESSNQQRAEQFPKGSGPNKRFGLQPRASFKHSNNSNNNNNSSNNMYASDGNNGNLPQLKRRNVPRHEWYGEEKSEKAYNGYQQQHNANMSSSNSMGSRVMRTGSYSTFEASDGMQSMEGPSSVKYAHHPDNMDHSGNNNHNHHHNHHNHHQQHYQYQNPYQGSGSVRGRNGPWQDDDDRTFDYGDRDERLERGDDDEWTYGTSESRPPRYDGKRANVIRASATVASAKGSIADSKPQDDAASQSPAEDDGNLNKSMDTPMALAGLGVASVATVGTIIMLGPVGMVIGAAAVGAGVVATQMPEEERQKLQRKAQKKINEIHDKAVDASERLGTSCSARYQESGMAEHFDPCFPIKESPSNGGSIVHAEQQQNTQKQHPMSASNGNSVNGNQQNYHNGNHHHNGSPSSPEQVLPGPSHPTTTLDDGNGEGADTASLPFHLRFRNRKVACLRNVRITPVGQIHSLDPSVQPEKWLDVLASAHTSLDNKIEAMEEIAILAKDRRLSRFFLNEGILDFFLFHIKLHQDKLQAPQNGWANAEITARDRNATQLAARCCMTLGKSHCAAEHTVGELELMSMYENAVVPEERQLAQMLVEIPYHVRVTKTNDPTIVEPSKEVFTLKQLALAQAEDLAKIIKELAA